MSRTTKRRRRGLARTSVPGNRLDPRNEEYMELRMKSGIWTTRLAWTVAIISGSTAGAQSFTGLGYLYGSNFRSRAYGISGDGSTVVGQSSITTGQDQAFRWTRSGGMTTLGPIQNAVDSMALAANVDGFWTSGNLGTSAFRWTAATGEVILTPLTGHQTAHANGVSGDGTVVVGYCGFAGTLGGERACRWTAFRAGQTSA